MLPKKHRLSKERFNAVFTNGVVLRSPHFLVRAHPKTTMLGFAVGVGKSVGKTSVIRHVLRRKVYASLAHIVSDKKIRGGEYVVMVTKVPLPRQNEMINEISDLLLR